MSDGWQVGWEGSCKIITHTIHLKALSFPMEIMMVGDGGKARLGDKFRQCQTQRKVQRDRNGILNDEKLQRKTMSKFI